MSDVVLVAIIAAVPATLGAVLGMMNRKTINFVHRAVNGERAEMRAQLAETIEKLAAAIEELRALKAKMARRK